MPQRQSVYPPVFDGFPSYKGGRTVEYNGYVWEFAPGHPLQNLWGFVPQHRWVCEDKLGRPLAEGEHVHHLDGSRTNNSADNLVALSKSEHHRWHGAQKLNLSPITAAQVSAALTETGGIKRASRLLHVDQQTVRNRFPELVAPYKRVSPVLIDNPRDIQAILAGAADPTVSLKALASELHIAAVSILRICERRGVPWVRKSKAGEVHRTYRKQPIHQA